MAEKTADRPEKKNILSRIARFFRDYRSEARKIVWPTKKQTIKNTNIVVIVMIAVAVLIGMLDGVFVNGIQWLGTLAK